ncbi:MAG: biotin-dependent carboxyltransferase family protein [Opitutaceae bacterium]
MEITVIRSGILTTVQDLGRMGQRGAGVPRGGAMDAFALRLANLLVGNAEGAAALECTLLGPELVFSADTVIAVGGADFDGLAAWQPRAMRAGERVKLGVANRGCRGYLAVAGGIDVPLVLGSRSTYLRGGFGGFKGRPLRDGDVVAVPDVARKLADHWRIDPRILPAYSAAPTVRVIRGAQMDEFGGALFAAEFKLLPQSDRMGLRLGGSKLMRIGGAGELVSTAVTSGTIQVPPDGQPIVLMADAQTLGGYPQVAHVISVDQPLIAQLRPGDRLKFAEVPLEEAHRLALVRDHVIAILHEGLAQKFR